MSAGEDRPLEVAFERRFARGGEEEGPAAFYSLSRGQIAADDDGRLYVLDAEGHRVVVFDSAGRALRAMGREGGGPGELQDPFSLVVGPGDTVWVYDFPRRGFVRFAPDGAPAGEVRLGLPYFGGGLGFSARRLALEIGGIVDRLNRLVLAGPRDTVVLDSLRLPEPREIAFESCPMRFRGLPPLFHPSLVWAVRDARAIVGRSAFYHLDVYDLSGAMPRRVASWRRDLAPAPATVERAVAEVGAEGMRVGVGGRDVVCDPREAVELRGFAERVPPVEGLAISPDGTVWVEREHGRGVAFPIDLLASDGAYLGTLPPGSPWPAAFLAPDRIAAIETDELDVDRVVVYDVRGLPGEQG